MAEQRTGGFWEGAKTWIYAAIIAIVFRTFAFEPFNIPSGSMLPTLLVGDYLFVSKYSFGYSRHSLPFSLPLIPGRILYSQPDRGDVVVFKLPTDNSTDYIKRIVGMPGDRVQVRGGILHINGVAVKRDRVDDYIYEDAVGHMRRVPRYLETLPGGARHQILEESDESFADNTPVFSVPPNHFFAMGDNRDNSRDSRFSEVGYVPAINLVGRAEALFFSVDGPAWAFWQWGSSVRFNRLFSSVE